MSAARPWMKFYMRDWRGDQALRACSLAARGLWMEMLAIMHEAEPYGHLVLNKKGISDAKLATMVGASEEEVKRLILELRDAEVFSIARRGIIYSRRMVDDAKKSLAGKARVSVRYRNGVEEPFLQDEQVFESTDQSDLRSTHIPEARVQKRVEANASTLFEPTSSALSEQAPAGKPKVAKTKMAVIFEILQTVLSHSAAVALVEHRVAKKEPLTARKAELLVAKYMLAPQVCGLTPDQAVDYQLERGWIGFNPDWVVNARSGTTPTARAPPGRPPSRFQSDDDARSESANDFLDKLLAGDKGNGKPN